MNHISTTPVDSQVSLIATLPIKSPLHEQQLKSAAIFAETEGFDLKFIKGKPAVKTDPYSSS